MRTKWISNEHDKIVDVIISKDEYTMLNDVYYYNEDRAQDVAMIIAEHYMQNPELALFLDDPLEIEGTTDIVVSFCFKGK
jgi:CTP:phosphocholine cytidylyltransferase-like protein